jgi:hypothetical protein
MSEETLEQKQIRLYAEVLADPENINRQNDFLIAVGPIVKTIANDRLEKTRSITFGKISSLDEVYALGIDGAMKMLKYKVPYDETRGSFLTFAKPYILSGITIEEKKFKRQKRNGDKEQEVDEFTKRIGENSQDLENVDRNELIRCLVDVAKEGTMKQAIQMLLENPELDMAEIGRRLGKTREAIRQQLGKFKERMYDLAEADPFVAELIDGLGLGKSSVRQ